jgi:hypothetical protein
LLAAVAADVVAAAVGAVVASVATAVDLFLK